ncbi:MAG: flagellar hook-basal body complex protein FliE [Clostridiales bacterium]|nr:flagellar hook-basal body complex protein FliE [Clostridiales bacterium]
MRVDNLIQNTSLVFNSNKTQSLNQTYGFKDILKSLISQTQELRARDQNNNNLLATGQVDSLENVMIDMEKADIALQFTLQIRNKILDAYQEIMRMQI